MRLGKVVQKLAHKWKTLFKTKTHDTDTCSPKLGKWKKNGNCWYTKRIT